MADEATLKDVTVSPNPPAAAAPAEPVKTDPAPVIDTTNTDAIELGQMLLDSGYTKAQINDLLAAPQALNSIRYQIENDPAEFIKSLERANPKIGENLLETASDIYVQRYAPRDGASPKAGAAPKGDAKEVPSELMSEVQSMREELSRFRTEDQRNKQNAAMAQTKARYDARVDDLFATDGVKQLGLTKTEQNGMRALLDKALASDQTIVQRVSNGNFIDVPRQFQSILNDWSADKKAAVSAEKSARERTSSSAFATFSDGPNPFSIDSVDPKTFDDWDTTADALANAYRKASGA